MKHRGALIIVMLAASQISTAVGRGDEGNFMDVSPASSKKPNGQGRHVITGVPKLLWGDIDTLTDDLMVSSALRISLDRIGQTYPKAFLAGTSGAAFDIGWAGSTLSAGAGGGVFAHPNHFEPGIDNLFKAIGRKYTIVYRSDQQRLWDAAVKSIDAGRPVVASEWKIDHFAVLAGYDSGKKAFLGRRYAAKSEAPDDYVVIKPDELAYVLVVGEKTEAIAPRQALLGALHFAVASARTGKDHRARGQGGRGGRMVYGPQAYTAHARMIPEQVDPEAERYDWFEHVLLWRLDALCLARTYAVLYLQENTDLLPPSSREHLHTAIRKYCSLLGLVVSGNISGGKPLDRIGSAAIPVQQTHVRIFDGEANRKLHTNLVWCQGTKKLPLRELLATLEGRQRFAQWLLQLRDLEEQAIRALEAAVTQYEE